jgi:5'-nucleotidase
MAERPLILVTNDDGILAPGLRALAAAARQLGDALVVAPDREMSAVSHAITLHRPLRVLATTEGYALSGTPVDCAYMGIHHIAKRRPDLVVSGVNLGPNLGSDVLYSGTVAAAREGTIQGLPAIAFSLAGRDPAPFAQLGPLLTTVMQAVLENGLPPGITLNVNIPKSPAEPAQFRATHLGRRAYSAEVVRRLDPRGQEYLWIGGGLPELEDTPGTDTSAVREGVVSLTPIPLFAVREEDLERLASWSLFGPNGRG